MKKAINAHDVEFYIDEEKGVVVAKVPGWLFEREVNARLDELYPNRRGVNREQRIGIAKLSPEDKWDERKGKRVALAKVNMHFEHYISQFVNDIIAHYLANVGNTVEAMNALDKEKHSD